MKKIFLFVLIVNIGFSINGTITFYDGTTLDGELSSSDVRHVFITPEGLVMPENWKCFNQIIAKSAEDKISLKAALEISPSYFLKAKNKKTTSKIRIVADACFR